jgi:hypothetical protein
VKFRISDRRRSGRQAISSAERIGLAKLVETFLRATDTRDVDRELRLLEEASAANGLLHQGPTDRAPAVATREPSRGLLDCSTMMNPHDLFPPIEPYRTGTAPRYALYDVMGAIGKPPRHADAVPARRSWRRRHPGSPATFRPSPSPELTASLLYEFLPEVKANLNYQNGKQRRC